MWAFANIGKEYSEVVPTWIDFDAACAVIFVALTVWVFATTVHSAPNKIQWVSFSNSCVSVSVFALSAAAGTVVACKQPTLPSDVLFSTVTLALPQYISTGVSAGLLNSNQQTETLSRDIFGIGHDGLPTGCLASGEVGVGSATSLRTIA
jgi:hypothetical protein